MSGAVALTMNTTEGRRIVPYAAGHEFFWNNVASLSFPAKDLVTLRGSATREVIFQGFKIVLNVQQDATTLAYMFLMRRNGLGTGGLVTPNFTPVTLDQSEEAATATVFGWTQSATTQGTLLGVVDMEPTASLAASSPQDPHDARSILTVPFTFPSGTGGISLNGVDDTISVGYALPGRSVLAGFVTVWAAAYWSEVI